MAKENTDDYYFENGFIVFTEKYHLRRGYCCKSGCRHCPYGYGGKTQDIRHKTSDNEHKTLDARQETPDRGQMNTEDKEEI